MILRRLLRTYVSFSSELSSSSISSPPYADGGGRCELSPRPWEGEFSEAVSDAVGDAVDDGDRCELARLLWEAEVPPNRIATDFGCVFDPLVPGRLFVAVGLVVDCDAASARAEEVRLSRVLGAISKSSSISSILYLWGLFLCSCRRVAPQGKYFVEFIEIRGVQGELRLHFWTFARCDSMWFFRHSWWSCQYYFLGFRVCFCPCLLEEPRYCNISLLKRLYSSASSGHSWWRREVSRRSSIMSPRMAPRPYSKISGADSTQKLVSSDNEHAFAVRPANMERMCSWSSQLSVRLFMRGRKLMAWTASFLLSFIDGPVDNTPACAPEKACHIHCKRSAISRQKGM